MKERAPLPEPGVIMKESISFNPEAWQILNDYVSNEASFYTAIKNFRPVAEEVLQKGKLSVYGQPRGLESAIEEASDLLDKEYSLQSGVLVCSDYETSVDCLIGGKYYSYMGIIGFDAEGKQALLIGSSGSLDTETDEYTREQTLATLVNLSSPLQSMEVAYILGPDGTNEDAISLLLENKVSSEDTSSL